MTAVDCVGAISEALSSYVVDREWEQTSKRWGRQQLSQEAASSSFDAKMDSKGGRAGSGNPGIGLKKLRADEVRPEGGAFG